MGHLTGLSEELCLFWLLFSITCWLHFCSLSPALGFKTAATRQ